MEVTEKKAPFAADKANELARAVPQWTLKENRLEREFTFADFRAAIDFVNRIAAAAEEMDHHPDISIHYNKVHLALSTHKAGGLTDEDFALAKRIDKLAA